MAMVRRSFRSISPVLLCLTLTLGGVHGKERKVRHAADTSPLEIDVDAMSTYDGKFMKNMQSPCRPEKDGYFGATYGQPVSIQFGFHMETAPLASITDVMEAVEDKLVDAVLATTFPQMCGFRRRRLSIELPQTSSTGRASGFRFLKVSELQRSCQPEFNQMNFCGVFKGNVEIFGRDQDSEALSILSMLEEVLDNENPSKMHSDLLRIGSADDLHAVNGYDPAGSARQVDGLSTIGKAGIALAMLIAVSGLLWFLMYRQKKSTLKQSDSQYSHDTHQPRHWGLGNRRNRVGVDYDPAERSLKPSNEPEAVSFGAGSKMFLTDGRPSEIEFDGSDSTSHYGEHSLDPRTEGII